MFATKLRSDYPRWATIGSGVVYAAVSSYAAVAGYFQWREADLRDLMLVLVIAVGWTCLWVSTVRFLNIIRHQALGLLLLILFAVVTIWNNMYDISKTATPVGIKSFPYGGLFSLDLRDVVAVTGIAAITVSTAASVLRPTRLSAVYGRLRDGVVAVRSELVKWFAILGGLLWAGESYSRIVDMFDVFLNAPSVGFFNALGGLYWWFRVDGTYILFLEAIVLVLMILSVNRMQVQKSYRIAALLGCCAVVCVAYAVSFPWPSEVTPGLGLPSPDYGPLAWSAPALLLLLGSAIVAMFRRMDDASTPSPILIER